MSRFGRPRKVAQDVRTLKIKNHFLLFFRFLVVFGVVGGSVSAVMTIIELVKAVSGGGEAAAAAGANATAGLCAAR